MNSELTTKCMKAMKATKDDVAEAVSSSYGTLVIPKNLSFVSVFGG